jgi:hypothetical protein
MAKKFASWWNSRSKNGKTELGGGPIGVGVKITDDGNPYMQEKARKHDGARIVMMRHAEWLECEITWRQLLDSYEGGFRYRNATYGPDRKGLPTRNLFRHRREYPDPGSYPQIYQGFAGFMGMASAKTQDVGYGPYPGMIGADPAATHLDDDYELRRSRTPVPEFVAEAVDLHLGKIYDQSVFRQGPKELEEWWLDVDGRGTPMDDYVKEIVAPLLLVLGCLDMCLDHPKAPADVKIKTRADELLYGLNTCCVSYILPQNMLWWRLDNAGRYLECLVREYVNPSDRVDIDDNGNAIDPEDPGTIASQWRRNYVQYRHWTVKKSCLYNFDGDKLLEEIDHGYGVVPIVRLIDKRKHRTSHVGKSRYEAIAEYQREYYNRDSELILSDSLQAHPSLSGPESYCKPDQTITVGPGNVLPKHQHEIGRGYEGWEYVTPPKDPARSIRENKRDLMDAKDRHACLTKPAGFAGAASTTVAQSGISKQIDTINGDKLLGDIAKSLARGERWISEYAMLCLNGEPPTPEQRHEIIVNYPVRFELFSASELSLMLNSFQLNLQGMAQTGCPKSQAIWLKTQVRQGLRGLTEDQYQAIEEEIDEYTERILAMRAQAGETAAPSIGDQTEAIQGQGTDVSKAGEDPTGLTGGTRVGSLMPAVM